VDLVVQKFSLFPIIPIASLLFFIRKTCKPMVVSPPKVHLHQRITHKIENEEESEREEN
jgi:hypothetical protein